MICPNQSEDCQGFHPLKRLWELGSSWTFRDSWISFISIIFLIFRFHRRGREDEAPKGLFALVYSCNDFSLSMNRGFSISTMSEQITTIWYWVHFEERVDSHPKIIGLLFDIKNLAFSVLILGWLLGSSWWTPSPGFWLVWCGWGAAWGVGSAGLCWRRNRVYLYIVSHLVSMST